MRHVKSNVNILKNKKKLNLNLKQSKSNNNFKKSSSIFQIIDNNFDIKTINSNNLINIFEKTNKNSAFNSIAFSNDKKYKSPNKKNFFNKKNKKIKTIYNNSSNTIFNNNTNSVNRGISIKLNFKNKIINNNFDKKNRANKSNKMNNNLKNLNINNNNNYKYDFNINERIKEKDKQITLLQKDLLQSQKLLNKLQEEKQKEISSTYNTIKNVDSYNNNSINSSHSRMSKYSSLSDFFTNTDKNLRILKTVYGKKNIITNKSNSKKKLIVPKNKNKNKKKNKLNLFLNTTSLSKLQLFNNNLMYNNKNCKTRNNIHKNVFNSGPNSNSNKKKKNLSHTKLMQLFSYSPNKLLSNYLFNFDSKSKTIKNTLRKNMYNNYNIINTKPLNSPSSAQNRVNNKKIKNIINNNNKSKDLNYIINKGEDLKKRTRDLLNNYIMLSYQIKRSNIQNK